MVESQCLSETNKVFGYETADGTFAQFTAVQAHQLMKKPPQLILGRKWLL
jgi:NADPH:quinone reductase-like Zn-dependent oxidoreductase